MLNLDKVLFHYEPAPTSLPSLSVADEEANGKEGAKPWKQILGMLEVA